MATFLRALSFALALVASSLAAAVDYTVTSNGLSTSYNFNGGPNNQTLTLTRGQTYNFIISGAAIGHPFRIQSVQGFGGTPYSTGVTHNGGAMPVSGATSGTVTFVVPMNAPNTLYYQCNAHPPMNGTLNIVDPAPPPPPPAAVMWDFNGDGRSDVLWRNSATGENYLYPMNGTAVGAGEGYLRTVADQNWQIAGVGDFDGDGKADILWRNSSTGDNYVYLMNGTSIASEGYIRAVADQAWQVVGVGDFNNDDKADILWRNSSTGENYVYLMNGLTISGEGYVRTVADQNWQVAGVGDFNDDNNADILWRNSSTGENYIYLMNGTAISGEGYIRSVPDQNWQVAGVGDFDGDGKADVLWRNSSTGENYLYPMNGAAIGAGEGYVRTVTDQNWQILAIGDYNGDGKADILWRNSSTGDNYIYPMNGTAIGAGEGYTRSVSDTAWNPIGPRPQRKYFALVSNNLNDAGYVTAFKINPSGSLSAVSGSPFAAQANPNAVAADPAGRFAYVANSSSTTISGYAINRATGVLSAIAGSPFPAGPFPRTIVVHRSGRFAYVTNQNGNSISRYSIDASTGALTSLGATPTETGPNGMALDASGRFAYVLNTDFNQFISTLSGFSIDAATGALSSVGAPIDLGNGVAQGITVDPSGKFVYLTMGNNVLVYSINSTTGAVTSGGSATAGTSPISVVVEPKGKFAYVANFGSNNVSAFSIDSATGALTSLGAPTPAGNSPRSITVDPAGKFVYVANMGSGPPPAAGTISAYSINPTSGALNSLGGPVPAGSTPYAIVTTRTQ